MTPRQARGSLTGRLALAFLAVALAAVAVLAGLTLWSGRSEVSTLVSRQQRERTRAVASELADSYREAGSWGSADLRPARSLAAVAGALIEVRNARTALVFAPGSGRVVGRDKPATAGTAGAQLGEPRTFAVLVDGRRVGTVTLRFPANGLPPAERQVRDALARTVLIGVLLAALVALAVALAVSTRIVRPLERLTRTARAMAAGDRSVRSGLGSDPGELGELARAFDAMADAVAREDQLRRALTADVAHELRTPLTVLRASFEALLDGIERPTAGRLSSLHDEVLRLGRIVEDLETLSAAEAAGFRIERQPLDLAEVARESAHRFEPQYAAAEVELATDVAPVTVSGDPGRLRQVAGNLLSNALKYTPPGGHVTLSVASEDGDARLTVRDDGPGIAAEELPRVFDRFWRGRKAEGTAGSGVGLAVVAELVRAHGGRVEAESEEGQGARFTVLLPRS